MRVAVVAQWKSASLWGRGLKSLRVLGIFRFLSMPWPLSSVSSWGPSTKCHTTGFPLRKNHYLAVKLGVKHAHCSVLDKKFPALDLLLKFQLHDSSGRRRRRRRPEGKNLDAEKAEDWNVLDRWLHQPLDRKGINFQSCSGKLFCHFSKVVVL